MLEDLSQLSDREHVRARPQMYIGHVTKRGLHVLVFELLLISSHKSSAGAAKNICVSLNVDGSVTIEDDGPGISVGVSADMREALCRDSSTLEALMTDLQFVLPWNIDGALCGVGPAVVNFLSEWCTIEESRDDKTLRQSYRCGIPTGAVEISSNTEGSGTRITFRPDHSIFQEPEFSFEAVRKRLKELAALRAGARFTLNDERTGRSEAYCWKLGLTDFVRHRNQKRQPVHPDVISVQGESAGVRYEIAFQYCAGSREDVKSFVNLIPSYGNPMDGAAAAGTHVSGFGAALTHSLRECAKRLGKFADITLTGDDFYCGLTGAIAVRLPDVKWEGCTRSRLGNAEAGEVIENDLNNFLTMYFAENPRTVNAILRKLAHSASLRCEFPPIDHGLFAEEERRLTRPEESPEGQGTAWFPASYKIRMVRRNGGEILTSSDAWRLYPIKDTTSKESLDRTKNDVVQQTTLAYSREGFPERGLTVAENSKGDLLVFIRRTDRVCGTDYPNPYADELYCWNRNSHEVLRIADDFADVCWAPCRDELL